MSGSPGCSSSTVMGGQWDSPPLAISAMRSPRPASALRTAAPSACARRQVGSGGAKQLMKIGTTGMSASGHRYLRGMSTLWTSSADSLRNSSNPSSITDW